MKDGARWDIYDKYLKNKRISDREQSIKNVVDSFNELASSNPAFQDQAECNGVITPIIALRTSSRVCKISLSPNSKVNIGDEIKCYDEYWLVMELYEDEYGLISGEIWLCNHLFRFQNHSSEIIEKYGIIDDGSYTNNNEKPITIADARYPMYISLDENTIPFYIDKRLAIGTMYNHSNEKILQVMKITWIDKVNQNSGKGSHLLKLQLANDVYNEETDDLKLMVCNYIKEGNVMATSTLEINGKATIRIGTAREYYINSEQNHNFIWSVNNPNITVQTIGSKCKISVPFDEKLVGEQIILTAKTDQIVATKIVEVVSIG